MLVSCVSGAQLSNYATFLMDPVSTYGSSQHCYDVIVNSWVFILFVVLLGTASSLSLSSEQFNQTKDARDYLCFCLESNDLSFRNGIRPMLQVKSSAHSMIGFANDASVGSARGSKKVKGFMFEKPVDLKVGVNHVVLLSSTMGMKDSGGELAEVKGGIQECLIHGLNTGTLDL